MKSMISLPLWAFTISRRRNPPESTLDPTSRRVWPVLFDGRHRKDNHCSILVRQITDLWRGSGGEEAIMFGRSADEVSLRLKDDRSTSWVRRAAAKARPGVPSRARACGGVSDGRSAAPGVSAARAAAAHQLTLQPVR